MVLRPSSAGCFEPGFAISLCPKTRTLPLPIRHGRLRAVALAALARALPVFRRGLRPADSHQGWKPLKTPADLFLAVLAARTKSSEFPPSRAVE